MSSDPMAKVKDLGQDLVKNLGSKALESANGALDGLSDKLTGLADGGGVAGQAVSKAGKATAEGDNPVMGGLKGAASGIKDKITGGGGGGGGGGGKATKSTNIIEHIDVGVPVKVAYNQWTEFGSFPNMMKKVENAEAQEDTKIKWKAQVFWSHREWESTIIEQTPDERIVWRSSGEKGYVDGAVSFHELGPNLTRILVVLEYYPQGLFERTGNLWRAQGRRARLELKHFRRHVMTRTILDTDEVEGWRGTIRDSEVVESHEDAVQREQEEKEQDGEEGPEDEDYAGDEESDEPEEGEEGDEGDEEEPEDEYDEDEGEPEDEYDDEEPEDEAEEEPEDELDDEDAEEEPEPEDEEEPADELDEEDEELEEEEPEAEEEEDDLDEEELEEDPEDEPEEDEPEEEDEEERPRRRRRSR